MEDLVIHVDLLRKKIFGSISILRSTKCKSKILRVLGRKDGSIRCSEDVT